MSKQSRFAAAFKEQFNMIGLAGAAALSAALLNPLPLLAALVAEAAYLLFVPDSQWYEARLSARFDAEVVARREKLKAQVLPNVPESLIRRFTRLELIRSEIQIQPGADDKWFRQVARKLDYLLEKFLLFAQKDTDFRIYLQSVLSEDEGVPLRKQGRRRDSEREEAWYNGDAVVTRRDAEDDAAQVVRVIQARYEREIAHIGESVAAEEDYNTQAVLTKRVSVLEQRRDYVGKIGKILTNLGHQMGLLEDSFGLINDQLRARSPEQVLADIEGVVFQTDSMTKLLEELTPFEIKTDDFPQ